MVAGSTVRYMHFSIATIKREYGGGEAINFYNICWTCNASNKPAWRSCNSITARQLCSRLSANMSGSVCDCEEASTCAKPSGARVPFASASQSHHLDGSTKLNETLRLWGSFSAERNYDFWHSTEFISTNTHSPPKNAKRRWLDAQANRRNHSAIFFFFFTCATSCSHLTAFSLHNESAETP